MTERMKEGFKVVKTDLIMVLRKNCLHQNRFLISKNSFKNFFWISPEEKPVFSLKNGDETLTFRDYNKKYFIISLAKFSDCFYTSPKIPKDTYEIY